MKTFLTVTAVALLGLAPTTAAACDEYDDSMASATPPAQLGVAATPQASKAAVKTAEPALPKVKQASAKSKTKTTPTEKVAVAATTK